ncbi:glutamate-1-semialdehyde aminotransferase [Halodesulfurarchaeum formicicum]|uniref:Glutamate-1-semialdehyde 2,1-aminomutase n=2 Tax=Halodesulfurarchaeum formicicum TaxID=1873524 RepID=A0A1D8S503_9EURY|nr:glutamate-1-semialdehyde aminotransferase [Halodesulfurarchaeum formicicum]
MARPTELPTMESGGNKHHAERAAPGSERLHESATEVFPGGVSHNIRYHEPHPLYVESASGATIRDVDGNEYVDYWMNHQTSVLGHAYPAVVEAVQEQAADGLHYGTPNETGLAFARKILEAFPAAERLRFTSSGTEATMYAVRLARATTGKDHILKAEGGWHGGSSDLSSAVHSPFDRRTTAGLPPGVEEHVHAFPINDEAAVEDLFEQYDVGGVIVEPMLLAGGGVECEADFLTFLREETRRRDAQLIFDEVVTGFRVSPGSYQARVGIEPDLTTFGKVAGGGLPIGGLAGRADLFERAKPNANVPPEQAILAGGGTFTMNPMTATAGLATLEVLESEPVYEHTESWGERVRSRLAEIFADRGVDARVLGTSSLFCPHFEPEAPLTDVKAVETATNRSALVKFHDRLIDRGHYHLPGHMGSVSYQTTEAQLEDLLESSEEVIQELQAEEVL